MPNDTAAVVSGPSEVVTRRVKPTRLDHRRMAPTPAAVDSPPRSGYVPMARRREAHRCYSTTGTGPARASNSLTGSVWPEQMRSLSMRISGMRHWSQ